MRKALLAIFLLAMLVPPALADDHTYDEQEVVFKIERNICTVLRIISHSLGVPANRIQDCRAEGHSAELPHKWIWGWRPHRHSDRYKSHYTVTAIYYVDGDSKVVNTQISEPQVIDGEGWSNLYEAGAIPIDQEVNVTMELQEENSSSYDIGVSFSITNRTSAKVSGGFPAARLRRPPRLRSARHRHLGLTLARRLLRPKPTARRPPCTFRRTPRSR